MTTPVSSNAQSENFVSQIVEYIEKNGPDNEKSKQSVSVLTELVRLSVEKNDPAFLRACKIYPSLIKQMDLTDVLFCAASKELKAEILSDEDLVSRVDFEVLVKLAYQATDEERKRLQDILDAGDNILKS